MEPSQPETIAKLPEAHKCNTKAEAIKRYGEIKDGKWANEAKWCSMMAVPEEIAKNWINSVTGKPIKKIYCNKDMQAPLMRALYNLKEQNLLGELKTLDGCFNIRDVRGAPGKASCHSYAIAIDINAAENGLGTIGKFSHGFVESFLREGFNWGGHFMSRKDPMHFSFGWENPVHLV
jgi:hypothetical protein